MKRKGTLLLFILTVVFGSFCGGFFLGRNLSASPVQVTYVQASKPPDTVLPATDEPGFPVNINTATRAQLMTLPGIGEVLSQRILDYRNAAGPFTSVTELLNVEGIGEDRLEQLLSYTTIGG